MIKKKKIEADLTNLKSETTTNQEQGKKIEANMTPGRSRQKKRELEKERVKKIERVRSFWKKKKNRSRQKKKKKSRKTLESWRKKE